MILNTSSIFLQGSAHTICQDFALNGLKNYGVENDAAWSVLSDGCSGSINSDIGARLLSLCAKNRLNYYFPQEQSFRDKLLYDVDMHREDLQLNKECLDATLLFIQSTQNEYEVRAYGDGAILKLRHDGNIELTVIEYPSNAPLYLNYYLDDDRFLLYKNTYGLQRKIFKYKIFTDFELETVETVETDETGLPYFDEGFIDDYKVIAVASDGIMSFAKFVNKQPEYISPIVIAKQLMDFKSIKGKFIERRVGGFKDFCEKNSIKHTDDFSMAGVSFEK